MKQGFRFTVMRAICAGLALCGVAASAHAAPPANDDCANAVALTMDVPVVGNNIMATNTTASCQVPATDTNDVFFSFTAPYEGRFSFFLTGTPNLDFDATLSVHNNDCLFPSGSLQACVDVSEGTTERANVFLDPGEVVLIRVAGFNNDEGSFTIVALDYNQIFSFNNDCFGPTFISQGSLPIVRQPGNNINTIVGSTYASCNLFGVFGPSFQDSADVFYTIQSALPGTYTVTINNLTVNNGGCYLEAFTSCGGPAIACDEPNVGVSVMNAVLASSSDLIIRVSSIPAPGIQVGGDFELSISYSPSIVIPPPPGNDNCNNAAVLPLATDVAGTTVGATGVISTCPSGGPDFKDVWYRFTAPSSATYRFRSTATPILSFDSTLSVYTNDCSLTNQIICQDIDLNIEEPPVAMTAGQTVLIRVAGVSNTTGNFSIRADSYGAAPANANCNNAVNLTLGVPVFDNNEAVPPSGPNSDCNAALNHPDNNALFYRFVAPSADTYIFRMTGNPTVPDANISLYPDCSLPFSFACDDALTREISRFLSAGEAVIVRVGGKQLTRSTFNVDVFREVLPTNTDCSLSIVIPGTGGSHTVESPRNLPFNTQDLTCGNTDLDGTRYAAWYQFTAPEAGRLSVAEIGAPSVQIGILAGTCFDFPRAELGCSGPGSNPSELAEANLTSGQTVNVIVAWDIGFGGMLVEPLGSYVTTFIFTPAPPPCPGDFDGDRVVEVEDIFSFLSAWFSQFGTCVSACTADIDLMNGVQVADIFAFLNQWFSQFGTPCP